MWSDYQQFGTRAAHLLIAGRIRRFYLWLRFPDTTGAWQVISKAFAIHVGGILRVCLLEPLFFALVVFRCAHRVNCSLSIFYLLFFFPDEMLLWPLNTSEGRWQCAQNSCLNCFEWCDFIMKLRHKLNYSQCCINSKGKVSNETTKGVQWFWSYFLKWNDLMLSPFINTDHFLPFLTIELSRRLHVDGANKWGAAFVTAW